MKFSLNSRWHWILVILFATACSSMGDNGLILFSRHPISSPADLWGIYAMEADGSNIQTVIQGPYFFPSVSHDGKMLLFTGQHPTEEGVLSIYQIPIDGHSAPILLTPDIGWSMDASFSPNKDQIVYRVYIPPIQPAKIFHFPAVRSNPLLNSPQAILSGEYIAIAKTNGTDATRGAHNAPSLQSGMQIWRTPAWHPVDPNRIAASVWGEPYSYPGSSLFVLSPDGAAMQELWKAPFDFFSGIAEKNEYPSWSPDGRKLAYVRGFWDMNTLGGDFSIWLMNADGSDAPGVRLTEEFPLDVSTDGIVELAWSADGEWIFFSKCEESQNGAPTHFDLYKIHISGENCVRLTHDHESIVPSWLPYAQIDPQLKRAFLGDLNSVTPTVDPIAAPTPSPTANPEMIENLQADFLYEFDQATLEANGWKYLPGGFLEKDGGYVDCVDFGGDLIPSSSDGHGLSLSVQFDQVIFLYSSQPIRSEGHPLLLRLTVRSNSPNAAIALAALKGGMLTTDGSIATHIPMTSQGFVETERSLILVYEPDQGEEITPVVQVAGNGGKEMVTVYIDRLEGYLLNSTSEYKGSLFHARQ